MRKLYKECICVQFKFLIRQFLFRQLVAYVINKKKIKKIQKNDKNTKKYKKITKIQKTL